MLQKADGFKGKKPKLRYAILHDSVGVLQGIYIWFRKKGEIAVHGPCVSKSQQLQPWTPGAMFSMHKWKLDASTQWPTTGATAQNLALTLLMVKSPVGKEKRSSFEWVPHHCHWPLLTSQDLAFWRNSNIWARFTCVLFWPSINFSSWQLNQKASVWWWLSHLRFAFSLKFIKTFIGALFKGSAESEWRH